MKIAQKIQAIIALTAMSTTLAFANATSTGTTTPTATGATVEKTATKAPTATASGTTTESSFVLSDVKVDSANELTLTFNNDLVAELDVFGFSITDENGTIINVPEKNGEEEVNKIESVDSKTLKLTLKEPLTLGGKYSLVVLFAADVTSATIEDGVGGTAEFDVPETFENVAMDAAAETPEVKAAPTAEECAANPDSEECKVAFGETTVPEAQKLPDTGAKETVLILMAILAASGVMFIKRKA